MEDITIAYFDIIFKGEVMKAIGDSEVTKRVYDAIMNVVKMFASKGQKYWGNPSGDIQLLDVYELDYDGKDIWVSGSAWVAADGLDEVNRLGIITTPPKNDNSTSTLGQVLEVNLPFYYSKRFNTRLYRDDEIIEIRNYGKFTVGRKGLKREMVFDFLSSKGYDDEILIDEAGLSYISILKFDDKTLTKDYVAERLVKLTYLIRVNLSKIVCLLASSGRANPANCASRKRLLGQRLNNRFKPNNMPAFLHSAWLAAGALEPEARSAGQADPGRRPAYLGGSLPSMQKTTKA